MAEQTFFELPTEPQAIGVLLPPAELKRMNLSALHFEANRRAIVEYIKAFYSDIFNDWVASNGYVMTMEVVAALGDKIALRGDILFNEAFVTTCVQPDSMRNHLALIGQTMRRPTPAFVNMEVAIADQFPADIEVPAGTKFTLTGADGKDISYEIFRTPSDYSSPVVIPAGKRGVIALGLEGSFANSVTVVADGSKQAIVISDANILTTPFLISVTTGDITESWTAIFDYLEKYGPDDKVALVSFTSTSAVVQFGDGVFGKALNPGQVISVRYRSGGGARGRISIGQINESRQVTASGAPISVNFRNVTASLGGVDGETLDEARRRAPRDYALHDAIVSLDDYAHVAATFVHPVYGAVAKAIATIQTSRNANLVKLYVLTQGDDGSLQTPSLGMKRALKTSIRKINTATDDVEILDGEIFPIDVDMVVVLARGADATVVKTKVEDAVSEFFAVKNWEMGEPFYLSLLLEAVVNIDGVLHVDLKSPTSNILQSDNGIPFNGLVTIGQRKIQYFYARAR